MSNTVSDSNYEVISTEEGLVSNDTLALLYSQPGSQRDEEMSQKLSMLLCVSELTQQAGCPCACARYGKASSSTRVRAELILVVERKNTVSSSTVDSQWEDYIPLRKSEPAAFELF